MRYLILKGLSPASSESEALSLAKHFNIEFDSTTLAGKLQPGDKIITGPWDAADWAWLPGWVTIEIVPDGGTVKRTDPLAYALKSAGLTAYRKKPPTEKSKNYGKYQAALDRAGVLSAMLADVRDRVVVTGTGSAPYEIVEQGDRAAEILRSLHGKTFAYDFETTSLDAREARILGVAVADRQNSWYITGQGLDAAGELCDLLRDTSSQAIAHGAKYEYKVGKCQLGLEPTQVQPVICTQVEHWVLTNSRNNGLKEVTRRSLGRDVLEYGDIVYGESTMETLHETPGGRELVGRYAAAGDARNTYDLHEYQKPRLVEARLWNIYTDHELLLTPVLAEMELAGFLIDRQRLEAMVVEYAKRRAQVEASLRYLGFTGNPGSGDQVAQWLYTELGLPTKTLTPSGSRGAVDESSLRQLADLHPAAPLLLAWSEANKLINTFLFPMYRDGTTQLFYNLQQTSARTGRLASSDPNVQNWPLKVRDIVVPPEGCVISAKDFNQIEPRIAAVASGDPKMLYAYAQPRRLPDGSPNLEADPYIQLGLDMGFDRVKVLTKDADTRRIVKAVFLGWMYGAGPNKMRETAAKDGIYLTIAQCAHFKAQLEAARPDFVAWRQSVIDYARQTGESRDLFGRRRLLPEIYSRDPQTREAAEREAVNMIPQGTSAGVIKMAMPKAHAIYKSAGGTLINQVHDEDVGWWTQQAEDELGPEVERIMVDCPLVPLHVESAVGPTWYQAKPR